MRQRWLTISIVILGLSLLTNSVFAQSNSISAQAIAVRTVGGVTGVKANIWTAQQPSNWYAIGSPVGICTTAPTCSGHYFETGYAKGTITSPPNILQQYAAWKNFGGYTVQQFGLGNLNNNTWYTFESSYSSSAGRWQARRNGVLVFQVPAALSFSSGNMVGCGVEGGGVGVPLGVECSNMQYRIGSGGWTSYDYTGTQAWGVGYYYCVYRPYTYGAIGWGPC
jgi:hypothetical protein